MNGFIQPGRILAGRYRIEQEIGVGGMAFVYRATDLNTNHFVAVKVLKPEYNRDAEYVARFQREAEAASKMTHHNIVNLLDVGMDENGNRYLIMEYVEGQTLKEVIQEKGRLTEGSAVQITIRILSALQHAHNNGIIHRDIKPQNILMQSDGHVKVSDFGIARIADRNTLSKGDSVMGTVHYFSPEQASGKPADVTSDLYSVGVTLYEMLTGRVPFDGPNSVSVAMQHLRSAPPPIQQFAPEVSQAVCHVCMKALDKNPAYRYQSAYEMARDLKLAINGQVAQLEPRIIAGDSSMAPAMNELARRQPSGRMVRKKHTSAWWLITVVVAMVVCYGLFVGTMAIYESVVNSAVVDDYIGLDASVAQRQITRAGLRVEIMEINHPTIKSGEVILQAPQEGTTMRKNDVIVLTVSKGPSTQTVPKLVDLSVEDALTTLSPYGLTLQVVEKVVSPTVPVGRIISQTPEAGSICMANDVVNVVVSGGMATVPSLFGKTLSEAQILLSATGLSANPTVVYVETENPDMHGKIAQQVPSAGSEAVLDVQVSLTICRVSSMMARARVQLVLPQTDGVTKVRVTLVDGGVECNAYEGNYPANASREPEVELSGTTAGTYTYRVYLNDEFAYQQQVELE